MYYVNEKKQTYFFRLKNFSKKKIFLSAPNIPALVGSAQVDFVGKFFVWKYNRDIHFHFEQKKNNVKMGEKTNRFCVFARYNYALDH